MNLEANIRSKAEIIDKGNGIEFTLDSSSFKKTIGNNITDKKKQIRKAKYNFNFKLFISPTCIK